MAQEIGGGVPEAIGNLLNFLQNNCSEKSHLIMEGGLKTHM